MRRFLALAVLMAWPMNAQGQAPEDPLPKGAVARLGTTRFQHGTDIMFLAYHPDGKSLFSAGMAWDPSIRQWDLDGREMRRFQLPLVDFTKDGFTERTRLAFYGPRAALSPNGKRLAGWNHELKVHIWDVQTGKELASLELDLEDSLAQGLAFSHDGNRLAVSHRNGRISLWDIAKNKRIRDFKMSGKALTGTGACVIFSPDDCMLIGETVSRDENKQPRAVVKAWETETGKELYERAGKLGHAAVLSADGKRLAYFGKSYREITVAEVATGKTLQAFKLTDQPYSLACVFAKDNSQLFVQVFEENDVRVLDIATGKQVRKLGETGKWCRPSYMSWMYLALSPDGKTLASSGGGQGAHLIDVVSGEELTGGNGRHAVRSVSFALGGKAVLTREESNVLRWWDWTTTKIIKSLTIDAPRSWPVFGTDAGGTVAVALRGWSQGSFDLGLTDLLSDKGPTRLHAIPIDEDRGGWSGFTVAAEGTTAAVEHLLNGLSAAHLCDLPSFKKRCIIPMLGGASLVMSADGRRLAVYTRPEAIGIFEGTKGRKLAEIQLPKDCLRLFSGNFSPDQRMLAFDLEDGRMMVWEVATGKPRIALGEKYLRQKTGLAGNSPQLMTDVYATKPPSASVTVAFSPDNKLLAHGRLDGSVEVWDVYAAKRIIVFKGHDLRVNTVAFSADGALLASGSSDTTVVVWETPKGGK